MPLRQKDGIADLLIAILRSRARLFDRAGSRGWFLRRARRAGFWNVPSETFQTARRQRCWLRKTLNVRDKFPNSVQPHSPKDRSEIWLAADRAAAATAIAAFAGNYEQEYGKAAECLVKDRAAPRRFSTFPPGAMTICELRIPLQAYSQQRGAARSA